MRRGLLVFGLLIVLAITVAITTGPAQQPGRTASAHPDAVVIDDYHVLGPAQPSYELMQASWDADQAEVERVEAARVEAERVEAQRVADEAAEAARLEAERRRSVPSPAPARPGGAPPPPTATSSSLQPCGGDLPPCYVAQRESGGNYGAFNPGGCSGTGCYGKWQFGGFWAGKLGLPVDIWNATPEQQDNAARILWNGGRGCSNWAAC